MEISDFSVRIVVISSAIFLEQYSICRIQFFSKPNPKKQQAQSDETGMSPRPLQIDLISEQEAVWCSEIDWDQSASGSIFCKF